LEQGFTLNSASAPQKNMFQDHQHDEVLEPWLADDEYSCSAYRMLWCEQQQRAVAAYELVEHSSDLQADAAKGAQDDVPC
jgi:hypothetical protein